MNSQILSNNGQVLLKPGELSRLISSGATQRAMSPESMSGPYPPRLILAGRSHPIMVTVMAFNGLHWECSHLPEKRKELWLWLPKIPPICQWALISNGSHAYATADQKKTSVLKKWCIEKTCNEL